MWIFDDLYEQDVDLIRRLKTNQASSEHSVSLVVNPPSSPWKGLISSSPQPVGEEEKSPTPPSLQPMEEDGPHFISDSQVVTQAFNPSTVVNSNDSGPGQPFPSGQRVIKSDAISTKSFVSVSFPRLPPIPASDPGSIVPETIFSASSIRLSHSDFDSQQNSIFAYLPPPYGLILGGNLQMHPGAPDALRFRFAAKQDFCILTATTTFTVGNSRDGCHVEGSSECQLCVGGDLKSRCGDNK